MGRAHSAAPSPPSAHRRLGAQTALTGVLAISSVSPLATALLALLVMCAALLALYAWRARPWLGRRAQGRPAQPAAQLATVPPVGSAGGTARCTAIMSRAFARTTGRIDAFLATPVDATDADSIRARAARRGAAERAAARASAAATEAATRYAAEAPQRALKCAAEARATLARLRDEAEACAVEQARLDGAPESEVAVRGRAARLRAEDRHADLPEYNVNAAVADRDQLHEAAFARAVKAVAAIKARRHAATTGRPATLQLQPQTTQATEMTARLGASPQSAVSLTADARQRLRDEQEREYEQGLAQDRARRAEAELRTAVRAARLADLAKAEAATRHLYCSAATPSALRVRLPGGGAITLDGRAATLGAVFAAVDAAHAAPRLHADAAADPARPRYRLVVAAPRCIVDEPACDASQRAADVFAAGSVVFAEATVA